jgi:hypothetical protein
MSPTITAAQRDALCEQIADRLGGIGDIGLAVSAENYDAARRLALEYSDELRLVSEDLGWGEGTGEAVELRTPPDVLQRALTRLRDATVTHERPASSRSGLKSERSNSATGSSSKPASRSWPISTLRAHAGPIPRKRAAGGGPSRSWCGRARRLCSCSSSR